MSQRSQGADEARKAGRGVLYIAFAKLYFMVAGAVIEFRLPAALGRVMFGAYGVVASTVSPVNNVLITGSIQAVSRFTAQRSERARIIQAAGLRMHLWIGVPVALAFIGAAPLVAHYFYHDGDKTGPLMLSGGIVLGYAFYAVFVGTANGRKEFHKQAALDICFATLRAVGILGLALAGLGVYGAISGWVGAVGVILVIAAVVIGMPGRIPGDQREPLAPMARFFLGVSIYLILLNLLMFVDQMLIKRLTTGYFATHATSIEAAVRQSVAPELRVWLGALDPSDAADVQVGYYRAVQNLARLSYQAIIAATFVIFPLVSRSTFESDADATSRYIRTTMRYSLIFATAIAVVFAANPQPLLDIPYAGDYAWMGAPALVALALGNVAFSLFAIAGTILNGAGHTRPAVILAGATLAVAAVANWVVIPRFEPGRDVLLAAACATGGAMVLGAAMGGVLLARRLGAFLPALTLVRVIAAVAVAMGVGRLIPATAPLATLAEGCVVGLTFLVSLVALRELTGADLRAFTGVISRRKGQKQ